MSRPPEHEGERGVSPRPMLDRLWVQLAIIAGAGMIVGWLFLR